MRVREPVHSLGATTNLPSMTECRDVRLLANLRLGKDQRTWENNIWKGVIFFERYGPPGTQNSRANTIKLNKKHPINKSELKAEGEEGKGEVQGMIMARPELPVGSADSTT